MERNLPPDQAYTEAERRLKHLIEFIETLPDTKKKHTTLRYLYTAKANMTFLKECCGVGAEDIR